MMKRRFFVAAMAMMMTIGSLPKVQAEAAQSVSLNIEKVEISAEQLAESKERQVAVNVRIEGNEAGFLAAEFGIVYDNRLTLETVNTDTEIGNCFEYMNNPETSLIWFSGANSSTGTSASNGRQDLFTLVFTLPEDYALGDVYYVGYSWDDVNGSTSSWYTNKCDNQIDWTKSHSIAGSIRVPNPSAPQLDVSQVQLNQGETFALNITNCDQPCIWYSDHSDIANVDSNGVITAYSAGTCTINCYAGASLLSCEVVVTEEYLYSIVGDTPIVLTNPDDKVTLSYPNPEGMVVWVSTASDVLTVANGRVTGLKNGTAQVIATSNGIAYVRQIVVDFPTAGIDTHDLTPEEPTTTASSEPNTTEANEPEFQCGDVDHNGKVNVVDVILVNRYLMIGVEIDEAAADVVQDGEINSVDSLTLLKYVVQLVEAIPVVK
ncbi:MAG: hypothetical protein K2I93_03715 [Oscillospiraceae bacterium]|nr:hypothetical protein [Oscillospiraceae bacterium]